MICPLCNENNSRVIDSRQFGYVRWRRYLCRACGQRFTTREYEYKAKKEKRGSKNDISSKGTR